MNWGKLILTAVVLLVIGTVFSWLTCGWLFNWVYQIEPVVALDAETMMQGWRFGLSFAFGFLHAFIWVFVYAILYKGIPGTGVNKGLTFGLLMWLIGALVGMISMPLYMMIAWQLVFYWIIQALALNLINGAIIGAMYKR